MCGNDPLKGNKAALSARADALFQFVMRYNDFATEKKDYGTGEQVCMVEAHTLKTIAQRPGIGVSELAKIANRTKGAISQTVKKLENMGYIYREIAKTDRRQVGFFPTERGLELDRAHFNYDTSEVEETYEELLKYCSMEEIDTFFRVVDGYLRVLNEE